MSRADFLTDVRDPDKQRVWRELAHRHAYVVPAGLVDKAEVPADSGLVVVSNQHLGCAWVKRAPMRRNTPPELPEQILQTLLRRLAFAEARTKGHGGYAAESAEDLMLERDRMRRDLDKERDAHSRTRGRAEHYRKLASRAGGWPCAACGGPLTATWSSRAGETWRHASAEAHEACEAARRADVAARKAAGERYAYDVGPRPAELEEAPA